MKTFAIILAVVGVSSAATLVAMDEKDLEKVMMQQMYARDPSHPFTGLGAIMTAERQQKEQDPEFLPVGEGEVGAEREARDAEPYSEHQDSPVETSRQPFNMFGNGMMAMMFPEMMFGSAQNDGYPQRKGTNGHGTSNGNGHSATNGNGHAASNGNGHAASNGNGHAASNGNGHSASNGNGHSASNGNGHAVSNGNGHAATPYVSQPLGNGPAVSSTNGNGHKRPVNGQSRPGNGHPRPIGNGNGKRGGGSAAAASAASFNRGSGSFSSSQAQAFGGFF